MFLCLNNDHEQTQKYIKSVTYHLHPTFHVNKITLTQAPFLLARVGWGWFDIQMDVVFQEWTKIGKVRLEHTLCFDGKGKTHSFDQDIDGDNKGVSTVSELNKLMKELKIKEEVKK